MHGISHRSPSCVTDCIPYPVLVGDESLGGRNLLDAAAESASVRLRPMAVGNSISLMRDIAAMSDAICFQIEIGAPCDSALVAIPLSDPKLCAPLVLSVRRDRQLPAVTAMFLEDLANCLTDGHAPPLLRAGVAAK